MPITRTLAWLSPLLVLAIGCTASSSTTTNDDSEVVQGANVSIEDAPWQTVFVPASQDSTGAVSITDGPFCGGSILNEHWILTARHCADGFEASGVLALAGVDDLTKEIGEESQVAAVDGLLDVEGYVDATLGKDIMLVHVSPPFKLDGKRVRSIPIVDEDGAAKGLIEPGVRARITGFGRDDRNTFESATHLKGTSATIVTLAEANASDSARLFGLTVTDEHVPATSDGASSACHGDSGGPFVVRDGSEYVLAGIVSWGSTTCAAGSTTMYTNVSKYASWIKAIIANDEVPGQTDGDGGAGDGGSDGDWQDGGAPDSGSRDGG